MKKKKSMNQIRYLYDPYGYTSFLFSVSMYKGREKFFQDFYNDIYRITTPFIHYSIDNIQYKKSYWEKI